MTDFSAQGPMLGYLYQVRYALYLILRYEEEFSVKIEGLDDITFESEGTPKELLQTKHRAEGATLSNTSSDFWKTIRIWSEYIKEGTIDFLHHNIILTLVTTADIKDVNTLASALLPPDSNKRNVTKALKLMKEIAGSNKNKENQKCYNAFLELNPDQKFALVNSIFIINSETRIEDLDEKIKKILLLNSREEFIEDVLERIEGWWLKHSILHLVKKSEDPIPKEMVLNKLHDIRDEYSKDNLPIYEYDFDFDDHDINEEKRLFVEQLRLISLNDRNILKAVNDYMRAYYNRSQWIRKELLYDSDLEKYEDKLIDEWERHFDAMMEDLEFEEQSDVTYIKQGRNLYRLIQGLQINIRERCQDPFIMRGSFHILANELKVGWHMEFEKKLKSIMAKAVGE